MRLAIDTNAYSDLMRGNPALATHLRKADTICLPITVLGELKHGFYFGNRTDSNLHILEQFLKKPGTQLLHINESTAELYGRLAAHLNAIGRPIPANDIWIAALCLQYDATLLTNDRDFQNLPQIATISTK